MILSLRDSDTQGDEPREPICACSVRAGRRRGSAPWVGASHPFRHAFRPTRGRMPPAQLRATPHLARRTPGVRPPHRGLRRWPRTPSPHQVGRPCDALGERTREHMLSIPLLAVDLLVVAVALAVNVYPPGCRRVHPAFPHHLPRHPSSSRIALSRPQPGLTRPHVQARLGSASSAQRTTDPIRAGTVRHRQRHTFSHALCAPRGERDRFGGRQRRRRGRNPVARA